MSSRKKAGDKKDAVQLSFEQVKVQLKLQLEKDQKDKAFTTYLQQLKNNANINDFRVK